MRESCTGGRSRYFVEWCHHKRDSGYTRAQQRGYSWRFVIPTPLPTSAGANASGGTATPGASVESSTSDSDEVEAEYSPSPKLERRAAHELRWLEETPSPGRGRTHGERRQLDLDLAALFVEEGACYRGASGMTVSVRHA